MKPDDRGHPHGLISALLDGDLAAPEREAVDRHLAGCPSCRDLLEDLRRLAAAAAADPPPPGEPIASLPAPHREPIQKNPHSDQERDEGRPAPAQESAGDLPAPVRG